MGTQSGKQVRKDEEKRKGGEKSMQLCHCSLGFFVCNLKSSFPIYSMSFSPALEIRSQLFSLLFDLRVHKPPSVNVPPPTPKTGKDFPSNINPINAY